MTRCGTRTSEAKTRSRFGGHEEIFPGLRISRHLGFVTIKLRQTYFLSWSLFLAHPCGLRRRA
jgi:hypothetical protein